MVDTFVFERNRTYTSGREFKGTSLLEFIDDFVVVDIETTGFSPQHDLIIEIAAIKIKNNQIVGEFNELVEIDRELPCFITNLTGITNEMLKSQKNIKTVLREFDEFLGDSIIVAHNANFDVNFLYDNFMRWLEKPLKNDFIDTMRIAKKLIRGISSFKLGALADYFKMEYKSAHRALSDVKITFEIYNKLREYANNYYDNRMNEIEETLVLDSEFSNTKVAVKTTLKQIDYAIIKRILDKINCKTYPVFYSSSNFLIMNDATYKRFNEKRFNAYDEYFSEWLFKADALEKEGVLKVISETDFCQRFGIPVIEATKNNTKFSAKDISATVDSFDETHPLYQKVCVFTGTLERFQRKDAMQTIVNLGGICGDGVTSKTNYLILGNNDYCSSIKDGKSNKHKKAEELKIKGQDIDIIPENAFYDMISDD